MKFRFVAALAAGLLMAAPQLAQAQSMDIVRIIGGIGGSEFLHDAGRADSAAGLRVVRLSTLAGAQMNADLLARALQVKQRDVGYLQSNLVINPLAMSAIRNSGVSLDQIVSIDLAGDGGGVLYADDL
ncbi:hypothetical protein [Devosia sp. A16]|uniref:hypothetical protein n=1 Tax=Devosia sp. A16 TaxID=1736675 RepID=UPI0006D7C147|nr:hypothetical protein [Devosia sp. A16]